MGRSVAETCFLLLVVTAPTAARADSASNAAVLQARASLAETDGDSAGALELLREAHAADPGSELIAYDLARLALEQERPRPEDLAPLLAMDLQFVASRRLKVYALLATGRDAEAARALSAASFEGDEANELAALLDKGGRRSFVLDAGLAAERDSNVTLLPDSDGARDAGTRVVLDTTLGYSPISALEVGLVGQLGRHLDNRDVLADYDFGIFGGMLAANGGAGPVELDFDVAATVVTTRLVSEVFTRELATQLDAQLAVPARPGLYARAALRDFVANNLEDLSFDRDAKVFGLGVLSADRFGRFRYVARAGFVAEDAQGSEYRQRGFEARGMVTARWGDFEVVTGLAATHRSYFDATTGRRDTRIVPSLDARYALLSWLEAGLGYVYTSNGSTSDQFRYDRHLLRVALTGSL